MKNILFASVLALTAGIGLSGFPEAAHADVKIYLGLPHFDYRVGPEYRFRKGYGWYDSRYRGRLSCNEARREVRQRGFRNVSRVECNGRTYTFRATRNGNRQIVYVNSRTGAVWR
jgi:hypothetical protein